LASADLAVLLLPPKSQATDLLAWTAEAGSTPVLPVQGKSDLAPAPKGMLGVSGETGDGVSRLRDELLRRLRGGSAAETALGVSERCLSALRRVVDSLERAQTALRVSTLEAASGEVSMALEALAELTGENVSEALLDEIFRRFCIGK
jgi:tRNA modification GTPase